MKKRMTAIGLIVCALLIALTFAGCSGEEKTLDYAAEDGAVPSGYTGRTGYGELAGEVVSDGDISKSEATKSDGGEETTSEEEKNEEKRQAGLITASAWDDNQYYASWQALFVKGQSEEKDGKFVGYAKDNWGLDTRNRVKVTVTCGEAPVAGATVTYTAADQTTLTAKTDAKGVAYLFTDAERGAVKIRSGETETTADFIKGEDVTATLAEAQAKRDIIKLMFVVDVTGSMGDEIAYLQRELADVIGRVATDTNTRIDLAFVFYRDDEDEEKMRVVDFLSVNDAKNLNAQLAALNAQEADGGGDWPEAVDEALETAIAANWGTENATRLIFHVLDAPPHDEKAHQTRFANAVKAAAAKGIRVCPILCSGADGLCEYLVRQEAIYTGGTFIFVTDHSGIGFGHHDPDLPNAVVEKLNDMLVRLISGYHTGAFAKPVPWDGTKAETPQEEPVVEPSVEPEAD